jgi:hypothetical protein
MKTTHPHPGTQGRLRTEPRCRCPRLAAFALQVALTVEMARAFTAESRGIISSLSPRPPLPPLPEADLEAHLEEATDTDPLPSAESAGALNRRQVSRRPTALSAGARERHRHTLLQETLAFTGAWRFVAFRRWSFCGGRWNRGRPICSRPLGSSSCSPSTCSSRSQAPHRCVHGGDEENEDDEDGEGRCDYDSHMITMSRRPHYGTDEAVLPTDLDIDAATVPVAHARPVGARPTARRVAVSPILPAPVARGGDGRTRTKAAVHLSAEVQKRS